MAKIVVSKVDIGRRHLDKLCEKIVAEMLKEGVDYAINAVGHSDSGETIHSIASKQDGCKGEITAGGAAVWLEFGTGVAKNSTMHPMASKLGMDAHGTHGKGHGANPNGWWYPSAKGTWTSKKTGKTYAHTKGIAQTRFMYNTGMFLRYNAQRIADKVIK